MRSDFDRGGLRLLRLLPLLLLFGAAQLAGQLPVGDGSLPPHPEAKAAISRLYSPFCPGFMLEVCTAQESIVLRDSINLLAYEGWNSDDLVEWMLADYGEQYRAVPLRTGSGLWAWILPPFALALGVGLVVLALRRFVPTAPAGQGPGGASRAAVSEEEARRLREAIRDIEFSEDPTY